MEPKKGEARKYIDRIKRKVSKSIYRDLAVEFSKG